MTKKLLKNRLQVTIKCIDCGKKRKINIQNVDQVKRCKGCEYRHRKRK